MTSFAITIPNLNQSRFLTTALESLRHQTAPFEIALMDGGSTDGFPHVAEYYTDIITYSRSGKDGGQSAAIKEGFDRVSGDIVAWLNADDYYFPDTLRKVADCFDKNPDVDVIYGNAVFVTPEGFFLSYYPSVKHCQDISEIYKACIICQPACFVRRRAYDEIGMINTSLVYTMDWDLWCRLAKKGAKFLYLPEVLAAVRYYEGTKTLSCSMRRYWEIYRIELLYNHFIPFVTIEFMDYDVIVLNKQTKTTRAFRQFYNKVYAPFKSTYRKLFQRQDVSYEGLLYGFHRWDQIVEGTCKIYLPWYEKQFWRNLKLKAAPLDFNYEISIDGRKVNAPTLEDNTLIQPIPPSNGHAHEIRISRTGEKPWRFGSLTSDLA
ncbi:glycosyltransferase family 2 protein [Desulfatiglans anilini]|uniref:glycosyltransferase family 2 protein n=1 Tax=Desulfatiglans anilini TaxID=90728 RepID=UPI00041FD3F0|nr:glycosyltransferase family 2 protein [Desulfatiglans anilini]